MLCHNAETLCYMLRSVTCSIRSTDRKEQAINLKVSYCHKIQQDSLLQDTKAQMYGTWHTFVHVKRPIYSSAPCHFELFLSFLEDLGLIKCSDDKSEKRR